MTVRLFLSEHTRDENTHVFCEMSHVELSTRIVYVCVCVCTEPLDDLSIVTFTVISTYIKFREARRASISLTVITLINRHYNIFNATIR